MAQKRKAADDESDRPPKTPSKYRQRSRPSKGALDNETEQPAEEHARQIVAQAYQEAARIIDEAKAQVKHIISETGEWGITADRRLSDLVKSGKLTKHSYEQMDDLFVQIRRCLADIAQSDQPTSDKLTNLVVQVEYWVESLVIESLKLASLERWLQEATELAKRLRAELD